ncbi:MAG: hypothetical protein JNJ83_16925 [Verrucomicrobiaceae bacterium]|nr:hypothetical protein [Verrucomicrobiaceae bacterium]
MNAARSSLFRAVLEALALIMSLFQERPTRHRFLKLDSVRGRFLAFWDSDEDNRKSWWEDCTDGKKVTLSKWRELLAVWRQWRKRDYAACSMTEAERKWAGDEGKRIRAQLEEDDRIRKDKEKLAEKGPCLSETERKKLNCTAEDIQQKCCVWDIGDEIRRRWLWKDKAEAWAQERIGSRNFSLEATGFDVGTFLIEPDKHDEQLASLLKKARGRKKEEIEQLIGSNKNAKEWLPVCYEYVRQSKRWLTWARLGYTADRSLVPFADSHAHSLGRSILAGTIGQGWTDALGALAEYLGQDMPFSEIAMEVRQSVARLAASASRSQVRINQHTFAMQDAGRPSFEPLMKWAGRQILRIANIQEATCPGTISVLDTRKGRHQHNVYKYDGKLNATVAESFEKLRKHRKGSTSASSNDDLTGRRMNANGEESIVIRVNWNTTSNDDLGKAFADLCERIRPTKWPEFIEQAGRDENPDKALRALLHCRMTAFIDAFGVKDSLAEVEVKNDVIEKRRALGRAEPSKAESWFHRITGDIDMPWWVCAKSKNDF